MVQWLKALKQQRDALNKATSALEEVPAAGNENAFVGACADVMCAVEQHLLQTSSISMIKSNAVMHFTCDHAVTFDETTASHALLS
jgi:hypothetical protein